MQLKVQPGSLEEALAHGWHLLADHPAVALKQAETASTSVTQAVAPKRNVIRFLLVRPAGTSPHAEPSFPCSTGSSEG